LSTRARKDRPQSSTANTMIDGRQNRLNPSFNDNGDDA
jgi:hypothetical protein